MRDYFKRLSTKALKFSFKHWKEGTIKKFKAGLADRYEALANGFSALIKAAFGAFAYISFLTFSLNIILFGVMILCLPLIFPDANYKATNFIGIAFIFVGSTIVFLLLLAAYFFSRKAFAHKALKVEECKKKLTGK